MRNIIYILISLCIALPVFADVMNFTATSTPVTQREDGKSITGTMSYKFYGAEQGSTVFTEWISPTPTFTGTINLDGEVGEFYVIACEDDLCSGESDHVIAQCVRAAPGVSTLSIQFSCP